MNKSKTIAIIGSSPISLFEAIYQAKIGNKVTVYDSLERVGGAWGNVDYSKEYNLELGCHIWDVDKSTYAFIESFLDEKLITLKPYPIIIYKKKKFPYDWKNNILIVKALKQDFRGYLLGKKFIKPILKSRSYKYPKGGSKQLMDKLLDTLSNLNVDLELGCQINSLIQKQKGWSLSLENKELFFDKVILTSLSGLKTIKTTEKTIVPTYKKTIFHHFHLIFKGNNHTKKLSYARLMDHPFIHRVSDISSYSPGVNKILSVGIFKDKVKGLTNQEITIKIKKHLLKRGWIDKKSELETYFSNEFVASTMDHFEIKQLKQLENLKVLRSTNFIFGLGNNVERWSKVIT